MSKSVITTSLALVLAMTMVLAVGKTRQEEGVQPLSSQPLSPQIPVEIEENIITAGTAVMPGSQVIEIQPDFEPGEVLLDQGTGGQDKPAWVSNEALEASLTRMQNALANLQHVARETGLSVAALEQQRSDQ